MSKKESDQNSDPLETLRKERDALQLRYDLMCVNRLAAASRVGIWGIAGAAAFVADLTFLGGIGTILAVGSGAAFVNSNSQVRKIGKQLKRMEETIYRLEEAQAIERIKNQERFKNKDLASEFSPAAQKKIADLQKQITEISKKLDDLQNPPPLDKPKNPFK